LSPWKGSALLEKATAWTRMIIIMRHSLASSTGLITGSVLNGVLRFLTPIWLASRFMIMGMNVDVGAILVVDFQKMISI
jgi:hypothetical protein